MAKKRKKSGIYKKGENSSEADVKRPAFVERLTLVLEEKQGRLRKEDVLLMDALSHPQNLVRKDQNSKITLKTEKGFYPEDLLEEILDDLTTEEILKLIPATYEESKAYRAWISECKMARDEDTLWRRITGYPNVNHQWTKALSGFLKGKRVLEIMAGNGLLSCLLQEHGAKVIATDIAPDKSNDYISMRNGNFTDVMKMDALSAIRRFGSQIDVILCSWPPQGEEVVLKALETFQHMKPDGFMIYIGEWKGGFNATDSFFERIEIIDALEHINALHVSLPGSKDKIFAVRLKK